MDFLDAALRHGTALALGLLIGFERERHPHVRAGVRTFALVALAGSLAAMAAEAFSAGVWIAIGALVVIGAALVGAHLADPAGEANDFGTTTIVAAVIAYLLGFAVWQGAVEIAAAVAIVVTALLHYKPEIEGFSQRLTAEDVRSTLQFAVLTFVILPLAPDRGFGPYDAINLRHVWLMVVLVSGVSFAGYIAWRLVPAHQRIAVAGLLGGLVSTTATTLVYSRSALAQPATRASSAAIISAASLVVYARLAIITAAVAPQWFGVLARVLAIGLVASLPGVVVLWLRARREVAGESPQFSNPANVPAALGFGLAYAIVLLASAWLNEIAGSRGLYAVAAAAGLTDVDAITLSTLRLAGSQAIGTADLGRVVAVAVIANTAFKTAITFAVGGAALGRACLVSFAPAMLALAAALLIG